MSKIDPVLQVIQDHAVILILPAFSSFCIFICLNFIWTVPSDSTSFCLKLIFSVWVYFWDVCIGLLEYYCISSNILRHWVLQQCGFVPCCSWRDGPLVLTRWNRQLHSSRTKQKQTRIKHTDFVFMLHSTLRQIPFVLLRYCRLFFVHGVFVYSYFVCAADEALLLDLVFPSL